MNEEHIRTKLISWAKWHWGGESDLPEPEVQVRSLKTVGDDSLGDVEYEAELWISSSADNPHISFFFEEERLIISAVEY